MARRPETRTEASPRLLAAARTLAVDALAAEAVGALRDAGVRSILLKGPALARWLYDDGSLRRYDDCDLLVDPADMETAAAVLARLGYEPLLSHDDAYTTTMAPAHAECWTRGAAREDIVDLHDSLFATCAPKDEVWEVLSAGTAPVIVAGVTAEVLDAPRRAVVVALHAAANGSGGERSLEDLRRAVALGDDELWFEALEVAAGIGATEAFAAGLRLLPEGRERADWLGLQPPASAEVLLHASTVPDGAIFLERLRASGSARERSRLLARALVPPARYMRALFPLARRGRAGLAAAYALRALTRLATAGAALRALRAVRRSSE